MNSISIVIPVYNEEESISELVHEIQRSIKNAEIVIVNDGSTDSTRNILNSLSELFPNIRPVHLPLNMGQSTALVAGVQNAQHETIVTMDGDGQNIPLDALKLLPLLNEFDLVTGIRKKRHDPWHKRITSSLANKIRSLVLNDQTSDTGCSLKAFKRSCFMHIPFFKGMHRFLPALFKYHGYSIQEIEVDHRPRVRGNSKYTIFNRGLSVLFDLVGVYWISKRAIISTQPRDKKISKEIE